MLFSLGSAFSVLLYPALNVVLLSVVEAQWRAHLSALLGMDVELFQTRRLEQSPTVDLGAIVNLRAIAHQPLDAPPCHEDDDEIDDAARRADRAVLRILDPLHQPDPDEQAEDSRVNPGPAGDFAHEGDAGN